MNKTVKQNLLFGFKSTYRVEQVHLLPIVEAIQDLGIYPILGIEEASKYSDGGIEL